jgi:D-amino-acid dehydrogenase
MSGHDRSLAHVAVVGGGVVGLWTAYHLREAGLAVTVLERDRVGSGASRGNAGEVCPGLSAPLPAPGVVAASLRTLHRRDSALYMRPQASLPMLRFLLGFALSSRPAAFAAGVRALGALSRDAVSQYRGLAARGADPRIVDAAYLNVYASREDAEASLRELERWSAELVELPSSVLDGDAMRALEPCLSPRAASGYEVGGQITVDPSAVVDGLAELLRADGVDVREGTRVTGIEPSHRGVTIETSRGRVSADAAVLSAGVWSSALGERLGLRLPIIPGKGYSFSVEIEQRPGRMIALEPAHVGMVPLGGATRVAGTMELDGRHDRFDPRRIEAIVAAASPYLEGVRWAERTAEWVGPRPMTPNGLPIIGAVDGARRVVVAAGHNMLGVTLAPGTARAVAQLLTAGEADVDLAPFAAPYLSASRETRSTTRTHRGLRPSRSAWRSARP